jgi:hypothetical protein
MQAMKLTPEISSPTRDSLKKPSTTCDFRHRRYVEGIENFRASFYQNRQRQN